jgi:hypothetical protein
MMKQLTIHIPDGKFQFVLALLRGLGFVKIDPPADKFIISEEQKALVNEELKKIRENKDYLMDWEEVRRTLKY